MNLFPVFFKPNLIDMPEIKILYIITKLELGGAQKQALLLAAALDKNKFFPYLFTAASGILVPDAKAVTGLNVYFSPFLDRPLNPVKDLFAFFEIINFIKKNKIDIVHTHSSKAGIIGRFAAKAAGAKIIIHTVHGWSFNDCQPYLLRKFCIFLERLCARITSKIIAVSQYDKKIGLSEFIGKEGQYEVILCGIDHSEFRGNDSGIRNEFGITSSDLLVGMVACFKPQKAPQDFIEVARMVTAKFENVKFIMVGDGQMRGQLQKLISNYQLKNKVILTGWRRDIPQILSALNIAVLTSLYEGLPVSILEAMASAKAVVATRTGGIAEVVQDGENGFLVAPKALQELADRVLSLLDDATLRKGLGENARLSIAGSFSVPSMISAHQKIYLKSIALGQSTKQELSQAGRK